jgi:phosphatidylinositol alpha-1,6-mannosyltransferase
MMPERLRIAIVTHAYPRFAGDWRKNFIEALAEAFAEHADVTVFVPWSKGWRRASEPAGRVRLVSYHYLPFASLEDLAEEDLMRRDLTLSLRRVLGVPLMVVVGTLVLARALRRESYDMIQAHWAVPQAHMALAARWLAGRPRTQVFSSSPGSDVTLLKSLGAIGRCLGRSIARSDFISCNSSDLKEDLVASGVPAERIELVLYGVDHRRIGFDAAGREAVRARLGLAPDATVLLMVGRFVPKKGFATALEALPAIVQALPKANVLLVGEGELESEYRAILERNGCGAHVTFAGIVAHAQLPAWYSACDVFLMPSARHPSDGLNVVVLEAMACARPIVASGVGGNEIVVEPGRNGFLHAQHDAAGLARAVVELAGDPERRAAMGAESLRLVRERFNWGAIARRYLDAVAAIKARR